MRLPLRCIRFALASALAIPGCSDDSTTAPSSATMDAGAPSSPAPASPSSSPSAGPTYPSLPEGGRPSATAEQDFAMRCKAPGTVLCVGFDDASDIAGTYGSKRGILAGGQTSPSLDSAIAASGKSSLKFEIPSNAGPNSSGSWFTNFSDDLSVQFGENSEFYVQWRQRFSPEFVSTRYAGDSGIKQSIINVGDQPNKLYASCEANGIVTTTYMQERFPVLYQSCTGSASHGPYDAFYEAINGGNDFKLQNARPNPGCLYTQKHIPNGYYPPNGSCFQWVADEWMTFQIGVQTGPRVGDEFVGSHVQLWIAREGKPHELVVAWGPYNLSVGSASENQRYGKVWFLPYQTSKDPSQAHATAYTWYDELVVSTAKIVEPK